jgi:hypothetical protein
MFPRPRHFRPSQICGESRPVTPLRAAQHILDAVREVHYALDNYRAFLPAAPGHPTDTSADGDDDIPF